jgi:hypothetical protein
MPARLLRVLSTTIIAAAACGAAEDPAPKAADLGTSDDAHVRLFTVAVPLPHAGEPCVEAPLPAPIAKLVGEGWSIERTDVMSKDAGGSSAVVLFELERHEAAPGQANLQLFSDPQMRQIFPGGGGGGVPMPWRGMRHDGAASPGAGAPVAPADKGALEVHWTDGVATTVTVGDPVGVRARAHVKTVDAGGKVAAEYDCTAFKDATGATEVDGRGATVTPNAQEYSPDSFTIKPDGAVEIEDDSGTRDSGRTDHPPTPAPAPANPAAPHPGPGQERQL